MKASGTSSRGNFEVDLIWIQFISLWLIFTLYCYYDRRLLQLSNQLLIRLYWFVCCLLGGIVLNWLGVFREACSWPEENTALRDESVAVSGTIAIRFCSTVVRQQSVLMDWCCLQNIDLHALTGWIPERIAIRRSKTSSSDDQFNPEREFQRILDRFHKGHCLITVATGEMPESVADRAGLVPTHAYAMLDIREVQVGQKK
jgi:hypothetical protein